VWSWHPLLVSSRRRFFEPNRVSQYLQSAGDGDKTNSSPGRARYKPLKPAACGNAGCFRWTCGDYRVHFFLHTGRGCIGRPAFPTPSMGARVSRMPRALCVAGCDYMRWYVLQHFDLASGRPLNYASRPGHQGATPDPAALKRQSPTKAITCCIGLSARWRILLRPVPPTQVCDPPSGSGRGHGLVFYPTG
jgi:hypothetical protein